MVPPWQCLSIALFVNLQLHSAASMFSRERTVYRDRKLMAYEPSSWDELAVVGTDAGVGAGAGATAGGIYGGVAAFATGGVLTPLIAVASFIGGIFGAGLGASVGVIKLNHCKMSCMGYKPHYFCIRADELESWACCDHGFMRSCYNKWEEVEAMFPIITTTPAPPPPPTPPPPPITTVIPDWYERTNTQYSKPATTTFVCKRGSQTRDETIVAGSNKCNMASDQCYILKCVRKLSSNPFHGEIETDSLEWGCVPEEDTEFCARSACCCNLSEKGIQMGNELFTDQTCKNKPADGPKS